MPKNIVLVHGWGASSKKLTPLARELRKLGWNVFIPKLPGFDLSPPTSIWTTPEYSEYILKESLSRFKSKKFFVFGHSFGGRIAIMLGKREKGIGNKLSGIVLCAASGLSRDSIFKRLPMKILARSIKVGRQIPLAGKLFDLVYERGQKRYYKKAPGIMKDIFQKLAEEDLKPLVLRIRIPTLILWSDKDRMTPVKDAYFLKLKIKNSKLKIFENLGHTLPYDKPQELAKEINIWVKTN